MLRRSLSTLKTAAESLAASEIKANKFITSHVSPVIDKQCESGAQFARFNSGKYPQLLDDHLAENVVYALRKQGYIVTHKFCQYKPMEKNIQDGETIHDKGNAEVVINVDCRIGV